MENLVNYSSSSEEEHENEFPDPQDDINENLEAIPAADNVQEAPAEDTVWTSTEGCSLSAYGLSLPDGTLLTGGQFRLENIAVFPNTRYSINKGPDPTSSTTPLPPRRFDVIMSQGEARTALSRYIQAIFS